METHDGRRVAAQFHVDDVTKHAARCLFTWGGSDAQVRALVHGYYAEPDRDVFVRLERTEVGDLAVYGSMRGGYAFRCKLNECGRRSATPEALARIERIYEDVTSGTTD